MTITNNIARNIEHRRDVTINPVRMHAQGIKSLSTKLQKSLHICLDCSIQHIQLYRAQVLYVVVVFFIPSGIALDSLASRLLTPSFSTLQSGKPNKTYHMHGVWWNQFL